MPHSQESDGIQISCEGIKYAPFTGIWWNTVILWMHHVCPIHRNLTAYRYLVNASSMPHSQESDGIQISCEDIKYVPFTEIWWYSDIFWRYQVCPIHRNLMAYRYLVNAPIMPLHKNLTTHRYVWRHQECHGVPPTLSVTSRPCAVSLGGTVRQSMCVLINSCDNTAGERDRWEKRELAALAGQGKIGNTTTINCPSVTLFTINPTRGLAWDRTPTRTGN
jgi:hypothetical protein